MIQNKDIEYWGKIAGEGKVVTDGERLVVITQSIINGYDTKYRSVYLGMVGNEYVHMVTKV